MASALMSPVGAPGAVVPPGATVALRGWDLVAGEYGPGTRFVLFTAGCPLRCVYCPWPQAWSEHGSLRVGVDQILERVDRYRPLFELTGGGVTLAGGEPLLHAPFVTALARGARAGGVHLALGTSGTGGEQVDDETLGLLDLVLLDLKAHDPAAFRRTTGRSGGPALRFAERVAAQGRPLQVKVVVVPGLTDTPDGIADLARFLAGLGTVERVDVVPFDRGAQDAWTDAGLGYPLARHPGPTHDALAAVRRIFGDQGLVTT